MGVEEKGGEGRGEERKGEGIMMGCVYCVTRVRQVERVVEYGDGRVERGVCRDSRGG